MLKKSIVTLGALVALFTCHAVLAVGTPSHTVAVNSDGTVTLSITNTGNTPLSATINGKTISVPVSAGVITTSVQLSQSQYTYVAIGSDYAKCQFMFGTYAANPGGYRTLLTYNTAGAGSASCDANDLGGLMAGINSATPPQVRK